MYARLSANVRESAAYQICRPPDEIEPMEAKFPPPVALGLNESAKPVMGSSRRLDCAAVPRWSEFAATRILASSAPKLT